MKIAAGAIGILVVLLCLLAWHTSNLTEEKAELKLANDTAVEAIAGWETKDLEAKARAKVLDQANQVRTKKFAAISKQNQEFASELEKMKNEKPENNDYLSNIVADDIWLQLEANNTARRNRIHSTP